ncbi:type II toxin-antitoxin system RelE/ParE family toxin [Deltaproteobacteria bacterium OttesenSCG-928-M10]|nr:type II toxin-antitoxin system RelE/ParE family toxin [Deltaproteobacteria bacterium OttesenSCG-928-M10]
MRIFKGNWFSHFAKKEKISDNALKIISKDLDQGQFDADLGGGVFKQRLARPGGGKSGGYRLIICFRKGELAFFIYAYPKSSLANITATDLKNYKKLAKHLLSMTAEQLEMLIESGDFQEITG